MIRGGIRYILEYAVSRLKDYFSSDGAGIVRFGTDFSDPPGGYVGWIPRKFKTMI